MNISLYDYNINIQQVNKGIFHYIIKIWTFKKETRNISLCDYNVDIKQRGKGIFYCMITI